MKENPHFKIEPASVNCTMRKVRMAKQEKIAFDISPMTSMDFRIVFSPTEEILYRFPIDFLINERSPMTVNVKGMGCMPRVAIKNGITNYQLGSVEVGTSKRMPIDVINQSDKPIFASLVEDEIHFTNQETGELETFFLSDRSINITPRVFTLAPALTIRVMVEFNPDVTMTSFDVPLVFSIAGAPYTLTTLSMRAIESRVVRQEAVAAQMVEQGLTPIDVISVDKGELRRTQVYSETKQKNIISKQQLTPSTKDLLNRVVDYNSRPAILRPLAPTENMCKPTLVQPLMGIVDWHVLQERKNLTVMVHSFTGVFLEILKYSEEQLDHFASAVDTAELEVQCGEESLYYELWHNNHLLYKHTAEAGEEFMFPVTCDDIKIMGHGNKQNLNDAAGNVELHLLTFSRGQYERNPPDPDGQNQIDPYHAAVKATRPNESAEDHECVNMYE
jgi:hypothetical protein